ncbi:hypothetical protein CYMTET_48970 [Cymbomonas tetramitiformis]|uniref:Uncharacterized protein n=1 Tax=Cymbomonas tetramitiformis TaxID=36881 RepID=A0AAE0BS94_9CHLO|nr:hypothetical protein CYMTET_48970 [Cymbomonas tetramitiformis]
MQAPPYFGTSMPELGRGALPRLGPVLAAFIDWGDGGLTSAGLPRGAWCVRQSGGGGLADAAHGPQGEVYVTGGFHSIDATFGDTVLKPAGNDLWKTEWR